MGSSPTTLGLATYPDAATGLNLLGQPAEHVRVGFGLYDGAGLTGVRTGTRGPSTLFRTGDLFLIGEAGGRWQLGRWGLRGRAGGGGWGHTAELPRLDGGAASGTAGFYLVLDHDVWVGAGWERGVAVFAQYGWADPDVSAVTDHVGAGVTWTGALPRRDAVVATLRATVLF
jgi:hypothetical protein